MKKTLLALLISLSLTVPAWAATLSSAESMHQLKYEVKEVPYRIVTSETDGDISAEHGIDLLLDPDKWILWQESPLSLSGSAVVNSRVATDAEITYSDDYKTLHIPVLSDFVAGEELMIEGMALRAYEKEISPRAIKLDVNGDGAADDQDTYAYRVLATEKQDIVPPYGIRNAEYSLNDAKTAVALSWVNPPDYDLQHVVIERLITRDGQTTGEKTISLDQYTETYTDSNGFQPGDTIHYTFTTQDRKFDGPAVELTVQIPEEETAAEPPQSGAPSDEPAPLPESETEVEELTGLYNYYKVRYQIKCKAGGNPIASPCLWARIDLIYAQNKIQQFDADVNLTDRDLYLMAGRIRWPRQRYADNCTYADTPAAYCPALQKAIRRVEYFIGE